MEAIKLLQQIAQTENKKMSFPITGFPLFIQELIEESSACYGSNADFWAASFMAAIGSATGKRCWLKTANYKNYPQMWIMLIGSSGIGKSEPMRFAYKPMKVTDKISYSQWQTEYQDWKAGGEVGSMPIFKQKLISDTTPEGLFKSLQHIPNGLTLYRDELNGWFSDFGRYNKSGEIGHYLSIFDNEQILINRKSEPPILVSEPLLSISGTIQPGVLSDILRLHPQFAVSGFAQRFLYCYPVTCNHVTYCENEVKKNIIDIYSDFIQLIMNDTDSHEFTLTTEAKLLYADFYNEMASLHSEDEYLNAVYSKLQIQSLRISLIVSIMEFYSGLGEPIISGEQMTAAIEISRYFLDGALRVYKLSNSSKELSKTELLKEIIRQDPEINQTTLAELFKVSRPYISKLKKASGYMVTGYTPLEPLSDNGFSCLEVLPEAPEAALHSEPMELLTNYSL